MTQEQRAMFRNECLALLLISNFESSEAVSESEVQGFVERSSDLELLQAIDEDIYVTCEELRERLIDRGMTRNEAELITYTDSE